MKRRSFLQWLGATLGVGVVAPQLPKIEQFGGWGRSRIVAEHGVYPQNDSHTIDALQYTYKTTFVKSQGETLCDLPVAPTGTTSRRIYRTKTNGKGPFYFVAEVPAGQHSYTDNFAGPTRIPVQKEPNVRDARAMRRESRRFTKRQLRKA